MDTVAVMDRVIAEITGLVDGVSPDQLGAPTPCAGWTVRDLINHVAGGAQMVGVSLRDGSVPDDKLAQYMAGDNLGEDFKESFHQAMDFVVSCYSPAGALDGIARLPFGDMPGEAALTFGVFDVATHAADLAAATGQSPKDAELYTQALAIGHQLVTPDLRQPGVFDAEQACASDASPAAQLLAFAGRKVDATSV